MTIDLDTIFKYKILNTDKLIDYGFIQHGDLLQKQVCIMKNQFTVNIEIGINGKIDYKVIDNEFGEEYALINAESAQGGFVGEVRESCEKVITEIANKCFDTEIFKAEQTKRVLEFINSEFGAQPEFLWDKFPDYAAFRRIDNKKWFAVIMTVDLSKIGLSGHGDIQIINLKAKPEEVEELLKKNCFYPGFHMNKKHWITACLDGSLPDETLFAMLTTSYKCANKKAKRI